MEFNAYIHERNDPLNPCEVAQVGFTALGYRVHICDLETLDALPASATGVVVAGARTIRRALEKRGIQKQFVSLPLALRAFCHRDIQETTLQELRHAQPPFFTKPIVDHKAFTGQVVSTDRDRLAFAHLDAHMPVYLSPRVRFLSEFRCFVVRGEILACQPYKGDPLAFPDAKVVQNMVHAWTEAPASWALDVGVLGDGRTALVEVNDGHSTGTYGLPPVIYARYLETRWCELTGQAPIP